MIEVSEYRYDPETGEEHYEKPVYLLPEHSSITFNTYSITGTYETVTVTKTGKVYRAKGEDLQLDDPTQPRILRPLGENRVGVREIFITGSEKGIVCIRRLPKTAWELRSERRLEET
jgi:hypothetical protein